VPLTAIQNPTLALLDTTYAGSGVYINGVLGGTLAANGDSRTLYGTSASHLTAGFTLGQTANSTASGYFGASFRLFMESATSRAGTASKRVAGTYTYTVIVTPYDSGAINSANIKTVDVSITVAVNAALSTTANAGLSSAVLNAGSSTTYATGYVDSTVAAAATASTTAAATIAVNLVNASGGQAAESVTVTTTAGTVGLSGGTFGRSVVLQYTSGGIAIQVRPDGTVGTATISVSSPSVTFASKSVNFYSTTVATLTGTQRLNTLKVGTNSGAFTVVAKDSSGNVVGSSTAVYVYSSNTAVVSETATACSYDSTNQRHSCDLTGVTAGTATISFKDGTGTILGTGGSVTVSTNAAATVKVAFDKATYAPGEKAYIIVSALDSAGKSNAAGTFTNLFATGGISSNVGFGSGSDTLTAVSITTDKTSAATGYESKEPVRVYTVYMPAVGGTVTLTATGGTSLPAAGQVAVTASASISDSGASALAAVTALASQVSAFITKINAQITTLTDLVMKIQKKVKA